MGAVSTLSSLATRPALIAALVAGFIAAAFALLSAADGAGVTRRVSVATGGAQGDRASLAAAISGDGRYVAFESEATTFVPGDPSGRDIFVHDRLTGVTERVNEAPDGSQALGASLAAAISGDGCCVAFQSNAPNLVPDDTNGLDDIFVYDRLADATERASVDSDGAAGNGDSSAPAISGDGRYVAFTSRATNLVPGGTDAFPDVFVHDRLMGQTELASQATDGTEGNFNSGGPGPGPPQISADGRFVVFGSVASTLASDDTNGVDDVYLRDRQAGTTERVSLGPGGVEGDGHSGYPDVSDDGRYVAFESTATTLATPNDVLAFSDAFLRDRMTGTTVRISEGPGDVEGDFASRFPVISGDGRVVAFQSDATNLVPNDGNGATDIFLYYVETGALTRASVSAGGSESNGGSGFPTINALGSEIAFGSAATNLVPGDTNGQGDIFVRSEPPPGPDSDADGCSDAQELGFDPAFGGRRDPSSFWDFFDTPNPSNVRDRIVSTGDILRIVLRFGTNGNPAIDPLSPPVANDYHTAFDRSPPGQGADPWDLGPPDGAIAANDILFEVNQFGHSCA